MDYTKSSAQELGAVIEHHKWVEGTEVRDQRLGQDLTGAVFLHIVISKKRMMIKSK